jgi:signal transduction histidine kinase
MEIFCDVHLDRRIDHRKFMSGFSQVDSLGDLNPGEAVLTRTLFASTLACLTCVLSAQDQQTKAKTLVKEAIAFAKANGREALLKETNNGQGRFHVKSGEDLYIFVYDPKGVCLAIGFQGNLVGVNRYMVKDPDGKYFLQDILKMAQTKAGGWVDYKYTNPKTGKVEQKSSYVEGFGDLTIGCGIYK